MTVMGRGLWTLGRPRPYTGRSSTVTSTRWYGAQTVPRPPLHQWGLSPTLPCRYHIDLPWWMMPRRLGKGQPWQGGEYLL